jgi:uncharacterized protein (DUF1499 family)
MNLTRSCGWPIGAGLVFSLSACASLSSPPAGLVDGHLALCPPAPHCVSSQASDPEHAVEPWRLRDPAHGWARVIAVVGAQPRTRIVAQDEHYLHAEVLSPSHLYTDDLELLRAPDGRIDVRSSSRIGYYDFGVNRKRVAALHKALEQAGVIASTGG